MHNFLPLSPEIFLLCMACLVLIVDVFSSDLERKATISLCQFSLVATGVLVLWQFPAVQYYLYHQHFVLDPLAGILKISIIGFTSIALLFAKPYILQRPILRGEYFILHLFAVLGMMIMVSGASLLTLYLGLELLALCLYALVAMRRDSRVSAEAAVKYFVMGAIASGFLLYGTSLVYGVTGKIHLTQIAEFIAQNDISLTLRFGLVFMIAGLAFKLGAVPFQMWVPDVYQGAPTSVTAFIASAPKVAAFGLAIRVLEYSFAEMLNDWQGLLIILATLSMLVGNLVALVQTNIKRLLAYSAIAHIGYFLLGIIAASGEGYSASLFYILIYALMTLGGFGSLLYLTKGKQEIELISDLQGLGKRNPWAGLLVTFIFLSMAGLPPFVGFWAKLEVILAVLNAGIVWLAVLAAFLSVIGLFYYLKVVKVIFFEEPQIENRIRAERSSRLALGICGSLVFILGFFPAQLLELCQKAFQYI